MPIPSGWVSLRSTHPTKLLSGGSDRVSKAVQLRRVLAHELGFESVGKIFSVHDLFDGVAMQRGRTGDTEPIRVATRGVFEFPCPSSTFEVGALIRASENAGGTALEDQQVEGVATANLANGRCAKRVNPAATTVLVDIVATISHGGPQTIA